MARTHRPALAAAALITAGVVGLSGTLPASAAWNAELTRYPYLTDVTTSSVQVTWADTYLSSYGTVTWGPAGGSCADSSARATSLGTRFTVGTTAEYQHSMTISGLAAGTSYCYRVKGSSSNAVDLLGGDPSPTFKTLPTSGTYSFDVFGDWGDTSAGYNTNQAKLNALMASSGASFAVGTGDIAYPSGSQNEYGDLGNTGTSVSQVFGPDYWRAPGAVLPFFTTPGNHGRNSTFFQIWPEAKATSTSGGSYQVVNYPASATLGYAASSGPGAWYAFNVAGTRLYVLTADWSDTNTGSADGALCAKQFAGFTCPDYQAEADAHWKAGRAEYDWLAADLQANPGAQKLAFFHYPLRSDVPTEPGDPYLQNSAVNPDRNTSLEKLLFDNGVRLAFNGHAHTYQRNIAPPQGLVSYVTGGGGAKLAPIAKSSLANCATTDAYGLGWSSTGGSYCGAAGAKPTSDSQVFHFLKVTVSDSTVTVTPTNADGQTFDSQTYDLGADASAPTAPGSVTAAYVGGTSPYETVGWTAATDNKAVTAYDVYRADPGSGTRTYLATVGPDKASYKDATAAANTAYTYSVDSRDLAGNSATGTTPPPVAGGTSAFTANADSRVEQDNPTTNFGTSSTLGADLDPAAQNESYLRFTVSGLTAPVTSAKLQVWTTTGSTSPTNNGPAVYTTDGSWSETGLTWNNRPPTSGAALDNKGALTADTLVEYDVTAAVLGNGDVNLKLMPDSSDGTSFNSRSGTTGKRPQLVVTTG